MHDYAETDPIPMPPAIPGKGTWDVASVADDGDDRDAASVMAGVECAIDRTAWLAHRQVNGLEGGGPYPGAIGWAGTHTLKAARVTGLSAPVGLTVTVTGTPNGLYDVIVECKATGTFGVAPGPSITWTSDGGATVHGPVALGAATTFALTGTGMTLNFAGGQIFTFGGLITFEANGSAGLVLEGTTAWDGDGVLASFGGAVSMARSLTVGGAAQFNDNLIGTGYTQLAGATLLGVLSRVGDTGYEALRKDNGPNASAAVQLWKQDITAVPNLTVDRVWTLEHPPGNACVEATIEWLANTTVRSLELKDGSTSLAILDSSTRLHDGSIALVTLVYDGAAWSIKAMHHAARKFTGPDGNGTINAWKYEMVVVPDLTADRVWTLTSPPNERLCEFALRWDMQSAPQKLTLKKAGGVSFLEIEADSPTINGAASVAIAFDGATWYVKSFLASPLTLVNYGPPP